MVPFLCSPPDPDGKISPFRPRIERRDCMSEGRAFLSHKGWDNLENYWGFKNTQKTDNLQVIRAGPCRPEAAMAEIYRYRSQGENGTEINRKTGSFPIVTGMVMFFPIFPVRASPCI